MSLSACLSVNLRHVRREWALLSFHFVCLSVGHSATYSLPRLIDHNQIWSAGIYLSSDPCKPFWIPYLPYFGCQKENMQNFAYFQRVFLPLRTWRIVPYDFVCLSVCLSVCVAHAFLRNHTSELHQIFVACRSVALYYVISLTSELQKVIEENWKIFLNSKTERYTIVGLKTGDLWSTHKPAEQEAQLLLGCPTVLSQLWN